MKKITLEMPIVSMCSVNTCAYNANSACHARAVTIGDAVHPGCDTFLNRAQHTKQTKQIAGIGACKMGNCKFNDDLECMAENVKVEMVARDANCTTFAMR